MRSMLILLCIAVAAVAASDRFITVTNNNDLYYGMAGANNNFTHLGQFVGGAYNWDVFGDGTTQILFVLACINTDTNCGIFTADLTAATPWLWLASPIANTSWANISGSSELTILQGRLVFTDDSGSVWESDRCVISGPGIAFSMWVNPAGSSFPAGFKTGGNDVYTWGLTPRVSLLTGAQNTVYIGSVDKSSAPLSDEILNYIEDFGGVGFDASGNFYSATNDGTISVTQPTAYISNTTVNCSAPDFSSLFTTTVVNNLTQWNTTTNGPRQMVAAPTGTMVYVLAANGDIYSYSLWGSFVKKASGPAPGQSPKLFISPDGGSLVYYSTAPSDAASAGWTTVWNLNSWDSATYWYNTTGFMPYPQITNAGIYVPTSADTLILQPYNANYSSTNVFGNLIGSKVGLKDFKLVDTPSQLLSSVVYSFNRNIKTTCDGTDSCTLAAPPSFAPPSPPPAVPSPLAPPPGIPTATVSGTVQLQAWVKGVTNADAAALVTLFTNGTKFDNGTTDYTEADVLGYVAEFSDGVFGDVNITVTPCSILVANLNGSVTTITVDSTKYPKYIAAQCNVTFPTLTFTASNDTISVVFNVAVWSAGLPIVDDNGSPQNVTTKLQQANVTRIAEDFGNFVQAAGVMNYGNITVTALHSTIMDVQIAPPSVPVAAPAAPETDVSGGVTLSFTLGGATNATLDSIEAAFNGSNNTAAASLISGLASSLTQLVTNSSGATTVTVYPCKVQITDANGTVTTIQLNNNTYPNYNAAQCAKLTTSENRFVTQAAGTPSIALIAYFMANNVPAGTTITAVTTSVTTNAGNVQTSTITTFVSTVTNGQSSVTVTVTATTSNIDVKTNGAAPSAPSTTAPPPPSHTSPPSSGAAPLQFLLAALLALQLVWFAAAF